MTKKGNGYLGSKQVETSTLNQEVIPSPPAEKKWTTGYSLYRFEFLNMDDCRILVNGETELFRLAGQGFKMDEIDKEIKSFIVVTPNVRFMWNGNF